MQITFKKPLKPLILNTKVSVTKNPQGKRISFLNFFVVIAYSRGPIYMGK